jgi:hypothetical protein
MVQVAESDDVRTEHLFAGREHSSRVAVDSVVGHMHCCVGSHSGARMTVVVILKGAGEIGIVGEGQEHFGNGY